VRWNPERSYPNDAIWERFQSELAVDLARVNPDMGDAEVAQFVREQLARYRVEPDHPLPLFGVIHGDDAGGVWLGEWVPRSIDGISRYTVIAPDGQWLGTVELPPRFRVLDIDSANGRVLGVLRDEMDVQSVAVFEISVEPLES
jgi:hypothetical protein